MSNLGDALSNAPLPEEAGGTDNTTFSSGKFLAYDGAKIASSSYDQNSFVTPSTAAKRTIILGAAGGWPSTTSGCADPTRVEYTTNKQNLYIMDFDKDTVEYAQWTIFMPDSYDGGTIIVRFIWLSTTNSGDVVWNIQGRTYGDGEAIDQAWGDVVAVTDTTPGTAGQIAISAESSAITLSGTPAPGELCQIRVSRNASNGSDTLAADARLIAIKLEYGINVYTD
ncbi:MAG: hypothetical protein WC476_01050 [Phycisphaerae bacterium]|jgi:hypothetical protein